MMTIASEIQRVQTNIANAYTSLEAKGATMPDTKNSANLASTVDSVPLAGDNTIQAFALDDAKNAVEGDKVLLNPAANTMKPIQEIASGATGGAGVMDVINNCLYKGSYKYYVDGEGNVQRESLSSGVSGYFSWWTNYGVFTSNFSAPYFYLNIQGTVYTQQDTSSSARYRDFSYSANGEYVFVRGYYDDIRDLLIYKNKIIHEFPVTENVESVSNIVRFMRDTKGDDYFVYTDDYTSFKYARRLTPNGVGEPILLTINAQPVYADSTKSACLGEKKNLLVYASTYEQPDNVFEAVLDMDTATISFTERTDLAEQLHEVKLTFDRTSVRPPFVSVGSSTEVLFHSHYDEGGMMCLSYDESAGTISFFKRWDDNVVEVSYDLPTDTYYYRTADGHLYKAHTIPQPQAYSAVKPSTEMFSPDVTLTGFVKENNNGDLEVLTAEDPNAVIEPVAESGGFTSEVKEGIGFEIVGNPTIENGIVSGFYVDDYFKITLAVPENCTSSEFVFKCNPDGAHNFYYGSALRSNSGSSQISVDYTGISVYVNGKYISGPGVYSAWVWIKVVWDSTTSTATTSMSFDGVTYTKIGEATSITSMPFADKPLLLGRFSTSGSYYFTGRIDLNECYAKANGEYIWRPFTSEASVEYKEGWYIAGGKYTVAPAGSVSEVTGETASVVYPYAVSTEGAMADVILSKDDPVGYDSFYKINKDISVWPNESYISAVEPETIIPNVMPNTQLVQPNCENLGFGSYNFTDGILSSTDSPQTSACLLPQSVRVPESYTSFEAMFKFSLRYLTGNHTHILGPGYIDTPNTISADTLEIICAHVDESFGQIYVTLNGDNSASNRAALIDTLEYGKYYWVKVNISNNVCTSYISEDGEIFTVFGTREMTAPINAGGTFALLGAALHYYAVSTGTRCELDLRDCYIKIDGEIVWEPLVEAPYVISQFGTVRGKSMKRGKDLSTLTSSGFNYSSDYNRMAKPSVGMTQTSLEEVICFRTNNSVASLGITSERSYNTIQTDSTGLLTTNFGVALTGTTALSAWTKYWVKYTYDATTGHTLSLSTDGVTYNVEATSTDTTKPTFYNDAQYFYLGRTDSNYGTDFVAHTGESYIKMDDVLVWKGYDIDDGTIGLPVCWKHIDGVLYEYKNGVPPTRALKLQEGQSVTLPGTNNLYVTKTGDVCGLVIANSSPVGVDSSAVIGTVELSKDGVLTAYTQTA